jgi:hypothetical protein
MKEASKYPEILQKDRSGHHKLLGEVSGSDLRCNPSKLSRSESQLRPPSLKNVPKLQIII